MKNSRVIVVDDELDIREALESWLSRTYKINCFESANSLLRAFENFSFNEEIPTCILIDLKMPDFNGLELQAKLASLHINYPVVLMSGNAVQADIIKAWHGGATDFILKPFTAEQISAALKKAFDKLLNNTVNESFTEGNIASTHVPITRREAQVLFLLGKGLQQIEVANQLGISLRTVKMYRAALKRKLNLNSQTELVRFCDKNSKSIELLVAK